MRCVAINGYTTLIYIVFGISHLTAFLPWNEYEAVDSNGIAVHRTA